jgi:hypothetical protein
LPKVRIGRQLPLQLTPIPIQNYRPKMAEQRPPSMVKSHERSVPSTRVSRFYNFGKLAVGLGTGAAAEVLRRTVGIVDEPRQSQQQQVGIDFHLMSK